MIGIESQHSAVAGDFERHDFVDLTRRTRLVVQTRWILLFVLSLYGAFASGFFYFSSYDFGFSLSQTFFLIATGVGVVGYNTFLHVAFDKIRRFRFVSHAQILLDILFITIVIHFSGGVASWLWPVYLIATIEASFLLDSKRDVWIVGAVGGIIYGLLLLGEFSSCIPVVLMPFTKPEVHENALYSILLWTLVSILNAAVAVIAAYLMSVIRAEYRALHESEERLVNFLDNANDLIHCVSPEGRINYVNRRWQGALGYSDDEIASMSIEDVIHPDHRDQIRVIIQHVMAGEDVGVIETLFVAKDGSQVSVEGNLNRTVEEGKSVAIWTICRDITERKRAEQELYRLAHHDALTGLPNRILFLDRLHQAKAMANRLQHQLAVMFLDLDRFKIINDTLGHPVGDKLLQVVAERLTHCIREVDTVARIGGDEFVLILVNLQNKGDVHRLAQNILKSLAKPIYIESYELFITTSIGICLYPGDGDSSENLVKRADIAMYHAKGEGRNNYQFYAPFLDENAAKRLLLENGLRRALDKGEFRIYYQPKVDISSQKIIAMEALMRWDHPDLGIVSPGEFIPLAEETGLIIPMGEWILRNACQQNVEWQKQGLPRMRMAVNLSGYQFQQKNLLDMIKGVLDETGLDAELLELEITESVIMQNPELAATILKELRDIGVHIAIDDFGTGYSSLAHLKRFTINSLKIDKSFVRDIEINSADAAIATAIIAMGSSLNLRVIAEGVETAGQLSVLSDRKCDEIQGFLVSTPMSSDDVVKFFADKVRPDLNLLDESARINLEAVSSKP